MRYLLLLLLFTWISQPGFSQVTFSDDVAEIIYNNCTSCHRQGGIAPFKLESYDDAYTWRYSITSAVALRIMPPWPPDRNYRSFMHERVLTDEQINTIVQWVNDGAPEGNPANTPPLPDFPDGKILPGEPDLVIKLPPYTSQAFDDDEYTCFPFPSGLTEDKYIRAMEVVPGNREIVHHVIVFAADGNITDCIMPILFGQTLMGYAPGAPPTVFPSGKGLKLGMKLKAGSNIIMQNHYPKGTAGMIDSTQVNFYFYDDTVTNIREITTGPHVQNFLFPPIQPNTYQTVTGIYPYIPGMVTESDMSLLAVFPHMHLIGETITAFAVGPNNDTIPLVHIPHWDFEWQGFYFYKNLIKIPAGSRIIGRGIYNNTTSNPHNPYNPPQTIAVGESTTDEMFLISFMSLPYQPGDENYNLEELMAIPTSTHPIEPMAYIPVQIEVSPNPAEDVVYVKGWNQPTAPQLKIYDLQGKLVHQIIPGSNTAQQIALPVNGLQNGVYLLEVGDSNYKSVARLVVMH